MKLIVHQAALGDFAMLLPLLRGLRGPTTLVAPASHGRLATRVLPKAEMMVLDVNGAAWSRMHAPEASSPLPGSARLVVSFVSSGRDAWMDNAQRFWPGARIVAVQPRPPTSWTRHASDWHRRQLLDQLVDLSPKLPAPRHSRTGPILLHPGSGGAQKCWAPERFERLIYSLVRSGESVRVVLGPAEAQRWPAAELDRWQREYRAGLCRTLDDLVDVLLNARMYVGNDAGPTHVAAQLGVPTLALFGPTSAAVGAPRGANVMVLAPATPTPMDWLSPTVALAAVHAFLDSSHDQATREARGADRGSPV